MTTETEAPPNVWNDLLAYPTWRALYDDISATGRETPARRTSWESLTAADAAELMVAWLLHPQAAHDEISTLIAATPDDKHGEDPLTFIAKAVRHLAAAILAAPADIRTAQHYAASTTPGVAPDEGARLLTAVTEERPNQHRTLIRALREQARLLRSLPDAGTANPLAPVRKSNRKISLPWADGTPYPMPNVQNHGTRNLGLITGGAALWTEAPDGSMLAAINGNVAGMVDLGSEGGFQQLAARLGPRGMQVMVAISRLLWEKTNHQPVNQARSISVAEVARAIYRPDKDRKIDRETRIAVARDLQVLTQIKTYAADGPYDRKAKARPSGWVSPLLIISAIHIKQETPDGDLLAYEFDAMLGRNWAEAAARYDMLQIPPGFMDLTEDNEIKLAWFYLTAFRYGMTKARGSVRRSITALCQDAGISAGEPKHRGRFLDRLHKWHGQLQEKGIIGSYARYPSEGTTMGPSDLFSSGEYRTLPPPSLIAVYAEPRKKAIAQQDRKPQVRH